MRVEAALLGRDNSWGIRLVGDYDRNLRSRNLASRDIVGNSDKVGAAPRKQNAESFHLA
jgi:hypothetical protein